jgi:DNA gyrase subunit A
MHHHLQYEERMELGTVERVDIDETMRTAYLSYAMSVITSRALPDVRDGLKPVQRRILYAMNDMGLRHDQPTRKSARIVGEVLGKYHPHSDTAVYDAMVRMAQDFAMRYQLVDGQGNFGSVDGDDAAAIRYTEARLTALGEELLSDITKDTVDFIDNFDGSLQEPTVLPAKLPNLLINGSGGIAVGMATNIPPHNLGEVVDAIAYLIDNYHRADDVMLDDLLRFIPGPDFPTGGSILGDEGIRQAYATGKGRIIMRAHAHTEDLGGGRSAIIITELPYQVNKANLVSRIATLFRESAVEGASDLRDESDRTGMRIVIELKRGVEWLPLFEALLKRTQMQATFGVNMLALVDGEPRTLPLKRVLLYHIEHRCTVIERRTRYDLERALARAHILEGLLRALDQLDAVIATIRKSRTADTARANLIKEFKFTELQAQAILDMQLRRLAALERRRIEEEYQELQRLIAQLQELLSSRAKLLALVKDELLDLKKRHGDNRRTRIMTEAPSDGLRAADLAPNDSIVIGVTVSGAVLRWSEAAFAARRGGVRTAFPQDAALSLLKLTSQQQVVFVTRQGQAASLPGHRLPDIEQQPKGTPLETLVRPPDGQRLLGVLSLDGLKGYLCLATRGGTIKRVALADLSAVTRAFGEIMGGLGNDELAGMACSDGQSDLLLVSAQGKAIRFAEDTVRAQGLSATGMKGMDLKDDDQVVGLAALAGQGQVIIATERGFAKRSPASEYASQGRGGQGAAAMDISKLDACGPVIGVAVANSEDAVALGTERGINVHLAVAEIPAAPRASWGRIVTRTGRNAVVELTKSDRVITLFTVATGGAMAEPEPPSPGPQGPSAARPAATPGKATPTPSAPRRKTSGRIGAASAKEAVADKPATARRRKPTAAAQSAPVAAKGESPVADAPTSPKRKPRAKSSVDAPQVAAPDQRADVASAAKPAPKRRKPATAVQAEPISTTAEPDATAAPAPPRRKPRAASRDASPAATPQDAATTGASEESAPQPEPPARRSPTRRAPRRRTS